MPKLDPIAKKSMEKLPPYSLEAEQAILGALLLDHTSIYKALETLTANAPESDFYRASHAKIWKALFAIIVTRNESADLLLLAKELERRGELEAIGGPAYLASLVDAVPTAANIEYHAALVHDKAVARGLLNASIETAARVYDDKESALTIFADHQSALNDLGHGLAQGDICLASAILPSVTEQIEKEHKNKQSLTGVPSDLADLDALTGGFQPADLIILAARPSMGKTALAAKVARACAKQGSVALFFSLEMNKESLLKMRFLAQMAKVNMQSIPQWRDEDWARYASAAEEIESLPIFIDDNSANVPALIEAKCRRIQSKQPVGIVIVDYIGLFPADKKARYENRNLEVAQHSKELKILAKKLNVPVIALSQLNRACEKRPDKRPMLSDLRDSGALEQDADLVLFLYRHEVYEPGVFPGVAEIIVAKQRNGATGSIATGFLKEYTLFQDLTHEVKSAYYRRDTGNENEEVF